MSFAIKIRYERPGRAEAEIRRTKLGTEPSLEDLREKTKALFDLPDDKVWYFKWTDEDGDAITVTEPEELQDAVQHAALRQQHVLNLRLVVEEEEEDKRRGRNQNAAPREHDYTKVVLDFVGPWLQRGGGFPQPDPSSSSSSSAAPPPCRPTPCGPAPRVGARCDVTNMALRIGEGWFHELGTAHDLCAEEFAKLSEGEQAKFVGVERPEDLGEDKPAYVLPGHKCGGGRWKKGGDGCGRRRGRCHKQKADASGGNNPSPFGFAEVGERLRQGLAEDFKREFRAFCDKTNRLLTINDPLGWYHKIGHNYDLCEAAFLALPDSDKQGFIKVESGCDLGSDAHRYLSLGDAFGSLVTRFRSAFEEDHQGEAQQSPKGTRSDEDVVVVQREEMELVAGPSVAPHTSVAPGARLLPVWEVRNVGAEGSIWTDVRFKPRHSNPLQVKEDGEEVPMLQAGASGMVSLDFVVPDDVAGQTVRAEFELVDRNGNPFGTPLSLTLEVEPKALVLEEKERAGVETLRQMGFSNMETNLSALRENSGDVNAAALSLLRK